MGSIRTDEILCKNKMIISKIQFTCIFVLLFMPGSNMAVAVLCVKLVPLQNVM